MRGIYSWLPTLWLRNLFWRIHKRLAPAKYILANTQTVCDREIYFGEHTNDLWLRNIFWRTHKRLAPAKYILANTARTTHTIHPTQPNKIKKPFAEANGLLIDSMLLKFAPANFLQMHFILSYSCSTLYSSQVSLTKLFLVQIVTST